MLLTVKVTAELVQNCHFSHKTGTLTTDKLRIGMAKEDVQADLRIL